MVSEMSEAQRKRMASGAQLLYEKDQWTAWQIAGAYGVSEDVIRRLLRESGTVMRAPGRPKGRKYPGLKRRNATDEKDSP